MELHKTHTLVLDQGNPEKKRTEILEYFHATYDLYEMLYETLKEDGAFYLRADRLRHPLIFYLGHTAAFFINKLIIARVIEKRINPRFESLFAVGVDEMSWDDLDASHHDWPTVQEAKRYRDQVRQQVDEIIRSTPLTLPITWNSPLWAILMGIEHERIHLETSSVLIRQLPLEQVRPHEFWRICRESGPAPENRLLPVPGGKVELGKGWDPSTAGTTSMDITRRRWMTSPPRSTWSRTGNTWPSSRQGAIGKRGGGPRRGGPGAPSRRRISLSFG
jgi:hypothetical protein